jgi:hypothetical protein
VVLAGTVSALQICGVIRGNIAVPDRDPKTWRAKGRKKRPQPAIASAIVTPAKVKGQMGEAELQAAKTPRSAIVEAKGNSMLAHLLSEVTDEERNRRADLADEMFREICRKAALPE